MEKRGHRDPINEDCYINISANSNTLKSILILEKDYRVDFNHPNSIAKVLNILSILVNIDIISGSYINGTTKNTIHSFFPTVSPGYKIIESPVNLVYLPITLDTIDSLEVSITDQDGHLLNFRNEKLTIRFHIREAR